MSEEKRRSPIRISFKYNQDTGEIVEFIVDDSTPEASEEYHDRIASTISSHLGRNPDIQDAGHVLHDESQLSVVVTSTDDEKKTQEEESTQTD